MTSTRINSFIRELSLRGIAKIPSVQQYIKLIREPREDARYGDADPYIQARRAWIDSNKALSYCWKVSECSDYYLDQRFYRSTYPSSTPTISEMDGEVYAALNALRNYGYYVFKIRLSQDTLCQIQSIIRKNSLRPELANQAKASAEIDRDDAIRHSDRLRFYYSDTSVHSVSRKLGNYESTLGVIARQYLGSTRVFSRCSGWLSVGRSRQKARDLSDAAQMFHFDYDAFNFLKVFVYLSDVDNTNGMHEYISSSHKGFPLKEDILKSMPPYFRISKEQLLSIYKDNSLVVGHCGLAGTIIIEDTSGFHRGAPLLSDATRDIFVLEYLDSDLRALSSGASTE